MGSSMTASLENPLSSLSSGYFSDSTSFKVRPLNDVEELFTKMKPNVNDVEQVYSKMKSGALEDNIQVVEQEDEEPSILTTKSFMQTTQKPVVPHHAAPHMAPHHTAPNHKAPHPAAPKHKAPHHTAPHHAAPHHTAPHPTALHSTPEHQPKNLSEGYSHLDWSSSVPFNVAEEPDDVQGKSCTVMEGFFWTFLTWAGSTFCLFASMTEVKL